MKIIFQPFNNLKYVARLFGVISSYTEVFPARLKAISIESVLREANRLKVVELTTPPKGPILPLLW